MRSASCCSFVGVCACACACQLTLGFDQGRMGSGKDDSFWSNVDALRARLSNDKKLQQLEELLEKLWKRFPQFNCNDLDTNKKLHMEINALKMKMDGGDIEKVLDSKVQMQRAQNDSKTQIDVLKEKVKELLNSGEKNKKEIEDLENSLTVSMCV